MQDARCELGNLHLASRNSPKDSPVPREIISAIDVGTTKICALIAGVTHDNLGNLALNLLGSGVVSSRGIRRGVVMDVPEVTAAIGEAVDRAEQAANQQMTSAYVGIADYRRAIAEYQKALTFDSSLASPYYGLAEAHRGLGDNVQARTNYQKYVDSKGRDRDPNMAKAATAWIQKLGG